MGLSANRRRQPRRTVSLYYDSGVLVKLYVREEGSDAVARFLAARGEAVIVNDLHELEIRNALRLKRFRDEIGGQQLAASMAMLASDLVAGRLIRGGIDWGSVCAEAERLSATMSVDIGGCAPSICSTSPPHSIGRLPGWCRWTTGSATRPVHRASIWSSFRPDGRRPWVSLIRG